MFFELIVFLAVLGYSSQTFHEGDTGAMLYVENLRPVQTVAGYMRANVRLDLKQLRRESQLLSSGFTSLRRVCETLLATEQHDLCERVLYVDQQTYRNLRDRMEFIDSLAGAKSQQPSQQPYRPVPNVDGGTDSDAELATNTTERSSKFLDSVQNFLAVFANETMDDILVDPLTVRLMVKKLSGTLGPLSRVVESKQSALLELLQPSAEVFNVPAFLQLISPGEKTHLMEAIKRQTWNIRAPTGTDEAPSWDAFDAADFAFQCEEDYILVRLRIPLVSARVYEAIRITVLPELVHEVLVFPKNNERDVLLIDRTQNVTLSVDFERYRTSCKQRSSTVLCDFRFDVDLGRLSAREHNCLSALYLYGKSSEKPCLAHPALVRSSANFWLATLHPNVWLYILPWPELVAITFNGRRTESVLQGVGTFELHPEMLIQIGTRVIRFAESTPNPTTGYAMSLRFRMSNETRGMLEHLEIPRVRMSDTILTTESERRDFFVQAVDESLLMATWKAHQGANGQISNLILYNVLAVLVVLILVLVRIALSSCGSSTGKNSRTVENPVRSLPLPANCVQRANSRATGHSLVEVTESHRNPAARRLSVSSGVAIGEDLRKHANGPVGGKVCATCK